MVTIKYFAGLREALGTDVEEIALPAGVGDIAALRRALRERGEPWQRALGEDALVRAAVNLELAQGDTAVRDGDEVAFFPPVTGG